MSLLNHIGVFLITLVFTILVAIYSYTIQPREIQPKIVLTAILIMTLFVMLVFESIYWIIQIFFK